jgi:hypothetical protein
MDENINFICSIQVLDSFLKGSILFKKFEMLHNLIVKVCYNESLFYIITISIYENLKYMITRENL